MQTRLYADCQKPGSVKLFLMLSRLNLPTSSITFFLLRRQKQTNKHAVPMPPSAVEDIYGRGMCVFVCVSAHNFLCH